MNVFQKTERSRPSILQPFDAAPEPAISSADDENVRSAGTLPNRPVNLKYRSTTPRAAVNEDAAGTVEFQHLAQSVDVLHGGGHEPRSYRHWNALVPPRRIDQTEVPPHPLGSMRQERVVKVG